MIEVKGIDSIQAMFAKDLTPAWQAIGLGLAEAIRDEISPYPSAPAKGAKAWYERGYGPRWRRRDGSIGGRKTSETLGRKWMIASRSRMIIALTNTASYAPYVHRAEDQTARHAATGWKTDDAATSAVMASAIPEQLIAAALTHLL